MDSEALLKSGHKPKLSTRPHLDAMTTCSHFAP